MAETRNKKDKKDVHFEKRVKKIEDWVCRYGLAVFGVLIAAWILQIVVSLYALDRGLYWPTSMLGSFALISILPLITVFLSFLPGPTSRFIARLTLAMQRDGDCGGDGSTGGPCDGSGNDNCSSNAKSGAKTGTALTSHLECASCASECLVICCSRNKLAPADGGCACKKPCKVCKCDRERDAETRSDESVKSDRQPTSGEREGRNVMDILGRLPDGRLVMESVDSFITKLAEIAFPNANSLNPVYAYSEGGTCGRGGVCGNKVLGGGVCGAKNYGGSCGRGGSCGNKVLGGGVCG